MISHKLSSFKKNLHWLSQLALPSPVKVANKVPPFSFHTSSKLNCGHMRRLLVRIPNGIAGMYVLMSLLAFSLVKNAQKHKNPSLQN